MYRKEVMDSPGAVLTEENFRNRVVFKSCLLKSEKKELKYDSDYQFPRNRLSRNNTLREQITE